MHFAFFAFSYKKLHKSLTYNRFVRKHGRSVSLKMADGPFRIVNLKTVGLSQWFQFNALICLEGL